MITYPNAKDENGEVHSIGSITQENRAEHKYYCLGCDKEMVPVLSEQKEPHFRHKVNDLCNPETYLHNLAKKHLAKQFETQSKFEVSYYIHNECPLVESCQLYSRYHWKECSGTTLHTIDLKKEYDTCQSEGVFNGFRADVLLTNSQNPDKLPVFLEVSVSHDCTPEKLESGLLIIELKVRNEADFRRPIIENKGGLVPVKLAPKRPYYYYTYHTEPEPSFIMFHNFERDTHNSDIKELDRFVLLQDGKMGAQERYVSCGEMETKHLPGTVFELNLLSDINPFRPKPKFDLFNLGFSQAMLHKKPLRHCVYCVNYYNRCSIPMEFEVLNRRTGQKEKVIRRVLTRSVKEEQVDKYALAGKCKNWHLNEYQCQRVKSYYHDLDIIIWEPKDSAD